MNTSRSLTLTSLILAGGLALAALSAGPARASAEISVAPAGFLWDPLNPIGTSRLVRNDSGLSASYQVSGLPAGHAVTMWFVVFNNPAACTTQPCGPWDLMLDDAAQGDFLWGAGNIVGDSGSANFGGHLGVGDASRSGFSEVGMPDRALGLLDPRGAEVHLLLHSHGPAVPGESLPSQLNSFLGGCQVLLGNAFGLATGPGDVPDQAGECVTFVGSLHQ